MYVYLRVYKHKTTSHQLRYQGPDLEILQTTTNMYVALMMFNYEKDPLLHKIIIIMDAWMELRNADNPTPAGKVRKVKNLKTRGHTIIMYNVRSYFRALAITTRSLPSE